jgi:hypothetical protein
MTEDLVISSIDEAGDSLRERFQHYGYLYFKNYVAARHCEQLLGELLGVLAPHIGFDQIQGHPVLNGEPFFETDPVWDEVYPKVQSLESFHSFFHNRHIESLMETVVNDRVFVYPIKMARIATPGKLGYETPPHQDAHSHQAGPTMAGIWVALHDMQEQMGRLQVLPYSHRRGVRDIMPASGVGGVQCEIFDDEQCWHVNDYNKGDVIIFHSCCVHKSEPNTAQTASRMSVDTRFCDYGAPVYISNLEPHHGWRIKSLNWESIYQQWQNPELQYYWQDYPAISDKLMKDR